MNIKFKPTVVYLDMVGDLFHVGHLNLFRQARALFSGQVDLIVGIHKDSDVASYKRPPIINENQRYELIRHCDLVSKVIEAAPLVITQDFIKKHKIDFVVHGDDISDELKKQHAVPIELGIVKYVPYTKGISTTEIIQRIRK